MSNAGFYIFGLIAIIIAVMVMKHVVTCLMRSLVIIVLLAVLAVAYYLFIGQYDTVTNQKVNSMIEDYKASS